MAFELKNRLVIGISSRSLFDLSFENELFEREGKEAYIAYQMKNEKKIYDAGSALSLVKRLLKINDLFPAEDPAIEVVLFSRNGAETSMRIWNSIANYGLNISRGAFAGGDSPSKYIEAFSVDLFLSADEEDVRKTLAMGHAAARIEGKSQEEREGPVKIAFEGQTIVDEYVNADRSRDIQVYKKVGVIALMTNNICSYIDTSLKGNLTTWTLDGHTTVQK